MPTIVQGGSAVRVAGSKVADRLALAVLVDFEIRGLEVFEKPPFFLSDGHAEIHEVDAGSKYRCLLWRRPHGGNGQEHHRAHGGDAFRACDEEHAMEPAHRTALYTAGGWLGTANRSRRSGRGRGAGRSV